MVTLTPLRKEEKIEETKPVWEVHISETPGTIYLKSGVLTLEGINCSLSYKQHEVMYT